MSWQVTRLQPEEFAEAIDLINYVFSHTYGPHDFETLLPKLYRPDPELVRCHYGVREGGALVALDAATAVRAAAGWCADQRPPRVTVAVPPWQRAVARQLGALADSTRVQCCGNWQVFDWPAVLAALLAERARSEPLPAGEAVVEIAGAGCLRLWVDGASAGCEPTDAAPQVRLDAAAALRALGGPLPGCFPDPDAVPAALRSWCPFPLHIPSADRL